MLTHRLARLSVETARDYPIMSKPTPEPVQPAQLVDLALAVLNADRFPYLATIDGNQPRVRPVSPVRTDGFTVYVANLRGYHKRRDPGQPQCACTRIETCPMKLTRMPLSKETELPS